MMEVKHLRGFTLVELVAIIVITGILAAVAAPRFFSGNVFDSRGFHDQVLATLRYAQKAAIAQHGFICVAFTANSVTLTYDTTPPSTIHITAACPGASLAGPNGPYSVSSTKASFTSVPAAFSFDSLGRPSATPISITVNGYADAIVVEQETGYVHSP